MSSSMNYTPSLIINAVIFSALVSIPFLAGGLFWLCFCTCASLRCCCRTAGLLSRRRKDKQIQSQVDEIGRLDLDGKQAAKLERTISDLPNGHHDFVITVHDNPKRGTGEVPTMGDDVDEDDPAFDRLSCDSSQHQAAPDTSDAQAKSTRYIDSENWAPQPIGLKEWCSKASIVSVCALLPMALISVTALLFSVAHTSATVAFIPVVAIPVMVLVLLTFFCLRDRESPGHAETGPCFLVSVPVMLLVCGLILYGLALDNKIPNDTTGEWAALMTPWWIWTFVGTVIGPCIMILATYQRRNNMVFSLVLGCGWCGVIGVFNMCLIGMMMKASGEWDLMPYAGFAGTMIGCIILMFACLGWHAAALDDD